MSSSENFPVSLDLRIDWSELDHFGHVNNVMFMKYIQAARINFWVICGIMDLMEKTRVGPMLASVSCDYRIPLFYPGQVRVFCKLDFIGNTSFGFRHEVRREDGTVAAEAKDVMVMYDFSKAAKVPIPAFIRENLSRL